MTLLICAPDIFMGDAVGNHCLGIARSARRLGLNVEIYAQRYVTAEQGVQQIDTLYQKVKSDDILLVSYSILDPYLDKLLKLECRKICYFHGVTPPELLQDFEPSTADLCRDAIKQLPKLADFDQVIANSQSTANYLASFMATGSIKVIPPVFADMPLFQHTPQLRPANKTPNLLMVGRVVPHKCIEDAIDLLAQLHAQRVPATLSIVGSMPNYDYSKFLINHARALGVLNYVDFNGMLDDADLFRCYEASDALLVMSRHEGFCVPVLEAMHFGKPVFVRGGTAAEELCFSENIISKDDSLEIFINGLIDHLEKDCFQEEMYMKSIKQAYTIMQKANDEVWRELLFIKL